MDEVITCVCGGQSWVIGASGTRCSRCTFFLGDSRVIADITAINVWVSKQKELPSEAQESVGTR